MATDAKSGHSDPLSLATRYSLLCGRHLSMQKFWNERHANDKKYIEQLQTRNCTLLKMLQIAQNEINNLKKTVLSLQSKNVETENKENESNNDDETQKPTINIQNDLKREYEDLVSIKTNKFKQREGLFYEILRECLFLSDPFNIRVLYKRSKQKETANSKGQFPLQSSLTNILKLRKQSDYDCDCYAIHYIAASKNSLMNKGSSYSTRIILMRNSLIICGVGLCSNYTQKSIFWQTMENIELELYTIAGIYVSNNEVYSYCNSMIIACSNDLTIAAQGINPINIDRKKHPNITCYEFNIFSDSKKLIHSLAEKLPDSVWHINNDENIGHKMPIIGNMSPLNMENNEMEQRENENTMFGRLGAGLYGGISGGASFLKGLASGISQVTIKPITQYRGKDELSTTKNESDIQTMTKMDKMKNENDEEKKEDLQSILEYNIADSPFIPQAEALSESGSVASSNVTTNTLDSSRSEQSNIDHHQSKIFARHKSLQRQQYINDSLSSKKSDSGISTIDEAKDNNKNV